MANHIGATKEDLFKLETGVRPLMISHLFLIPKALGLTHQDFVEKLFRPVEEVKTARRT